MIRRPEQGIGNPRIAPSEADASGTEVAASAPARRWRQRRVSRLPAQQRRNEILAAALAVMREKGWQDTSIAEIAERADVVEGSLYRFFVNRRDLLIKAIELWYDSMIRDFDDQLRDIDGTARRLRFMIWRHLKTIHDEPELCNAMFWEVRSSPDYAGTSIAEYNRRYVRRTLDIVCEGMEKGEFRSGVSLSLIRDLIFGCVEHQTWDYLHGTGDFDPDVVADTLIDLVLRSLATTRECP